VRGLFQLLGIWLSQCNYMQHFPVPALTQQQMIMATHLRTDVTSVLFSCSSILVTYMIVIIMTKLCNKKTWLSGFP